MARTEAEFGAQGGAHDGAHAPAFSEVPVSIEADVLLRVVSRHQVTNEALGRASGIAPGQISRYASGQFPVPLSVIRAAFTLTHDAELIGLLQTESHDLVVFPRAKREPDLFRAYHASCRSVSDAHLAAARLFESVPPSATPSIAAAHIDAAIAQLAALKSTVLSWSSPARGAA